MRLAILEYVFAGGLRDQALARALALEAHQMVLALVEDSILEPGLEPVVLVTPELADQVPADHRILPEPGEEIARFWRRAIADADAVLPVAPETGNALEALMRLLGAAGATVLGSRPSAVRIAASKAATAEALQRVGLRVVSTSRAGTSVPAHSGDWLLKPDDGVDCEGIRRLSRAPHPSAIPAGQVLQPLLPGRACSLCLRCDADSVKVLSVNHQQIARSDHGFRYLGSDVAAEPVTDAHRQIAQLVYAAIPGLYGFVGVDYLDRDGELTVLEVNPRLTTSFADLRRATGTGLGRHLMTLLAGHSHPLRDDGGTS